MYNARSWFAIVVVSCLSAVHFSSVHAAGLRTVVLSGDASPGTGETFSDLDTWVWLNNSGQVAFNAAISGSSLQDSGVWSEGGGSGLSLVAREGNPAPDTSTGVNYDGWIELWNLNDAGQVVTRSKLKGTGVTIDNDYGIWSEGGGGLSLVAREGDPAPGTAAGVNLGGIENPSVSSSGKVAFSAFLTGTGVTSDNDRGIWSNAGGSLALKMREGDISRIKNWDDLVHNDAGQIVFRAQFDLFRPIDWGIYSDGGGSGLAVVAESGQQAPGAESRDKFDRLLEPKINNSGAVAFRARLYTDASGRDPDYDQFGIWTNRDGSVASVAIDGEDAPGAPGEDYGTVGASRQFHINNAGHVSFMAELGTEDGSGIWAEGDNGLALVARDGDPAPGVSDGREFSFNSFYPNSDVWVNDADQIAFFAGITGGDGIWATNRAGGLKLIALEGEQLDVDDGPGTDLRTILQLAPGQFNNMGQIAFYASFTDGTSGLFVSDVAMVPEPSTFALAALGLCGLLGWHRPQSRCAAAAAQVTR